MADKASTLTLKVDLECDLCYKKIRKILCKLQDQENIRAIAYDEKNSMVTLTGPFDPDRLSLKLIGKASEVIKGIQIVKGKSKDDDPSKDSKPANSFEKKEKDNKAKNKKEKGNSKLKSALEPPKPNSRGKSEQPEKEAENSKSQPEPKQIQNESKPNLMVHTPGLVYPLGQPVWQAAPDCYCRPYQEGLYCCNYCGRGYGSGQRSYSCEEDPNSCVIM